MSPFKKLAGLFTKKAKEIKKQQALMKEIALITNSYTSLDAALELIKWQQNEYSKLSGVKCPPKSEVLAELKHELVSGFSLEDAIESVKFSIELRLVLASLKFLAGGQ